MVGYLMVFASYKKAFIKAREELKNFVVEDDKLISEGFVRQQRIYSSNQSDDYYIKSNVILILKT